MKNIDKLADLIRSDSPEAVLEEAEIVLKMISYDIDDGPVSVVFKTVVDLFRGDFPGYRSCNTEYHDLQHTLDTFLAMVRLIHGAVITGRIFPKRYISLGLTCSLLHDVGYIQKEDDLVGTGARHTANHVHRSLEFLEFYGKDFGLVNSEIKAGRLLILCTDLTVNPAETDFSSKDTEFLGKMLGSADLLAQMSDRIYLEKLLFLYREFKEARVGGYQNEVDLLKQTVEFYNLMSRRFKNQLLKTDKFVTAHFAARWKVNRNLYNEAIQNQQKYLRKVLLIPDFDPLAYLNRDGIAERFRKEIREQKK
jgi:hypothetical protein